MRLLPLVPDRNQPLGVLQYLAPKRTTRLCFLCGRGGTLAFHTARLILPGNVVVIVCGLLAGHRAIVPRAAAELIELWRRARH